MDIIAALAIRSGGSLDFAELSSHLVSHETRLNYNKGYELQKATAEVNFTNYDIGCGSRRGGCDGWSSSTGGRGGSASGAIGYMWCRDPCLICTSYEHLPYKCPFRAQAIATFSPRNLWHHLLQRRQHYLLPTWLQQQVRVILHGLIQLNKLHGPISPGIYHGLIILIMDHGHVAP